MATITGNQPAAYRTPVHPAEPAAASPGRLGLETAGLFAFLLGIWGAIVPYVGPTFGFSADGAPSWTWTAAHTCLFLIPGAVAMLGGLLVMLGASTSGAIGRPGATSLGALLALSAGAWFVVGPVAWPILQGSAFFHGYSTVREFEYWVGYSLGTGVLLASFGAFALGRPKLAITARMATLED